MQHRILLMFKVLVFTIVVPGFVLFYMPYGLLGANFNASGARLLGFVLVLGGALGYVLCAWRFATQGQGTPAPVDPPRILVSLGLYQRVRNPMYISVLLALVGEAILSRGLTLWFYALAVFVWFHLFVTLYEEPHLRKKFGASYEEYCHKVPRWIPRRRT